LKKEKKFKLKNVGAELRNHTGAFLRLAAKDVLVNVDQEELVSVSESQEESKSAIRKSEKIIISIYTVVRTFYGSFRSNSLKLVYMTMILNHVANPTLLNLYYPIGERAKRASFEEDEHTHDESREMATDGYIHY